MRGPPLGGSNSSALLEGGFLPCRAPLKYPDESLKFSVSKYKERKRDRQRQILINVRIGKNYVQFSKT